MLAILSVHRYSCEPCLKSRVTEQRRKFNIIPRGIGHCAYPSLPLCFHSITASAICSTLASRYRRQLRNKTFPNVLQPRPTPLQLLIPFLQTTGVRHLPKANVNFNPVPSISSICSSSISPSFVTQTTKSRQLYFKVICSPRESMRPTYSRA